MSGLIWIQSVWHSDDTIFLIEFFEKVDVEKNSAKDKKHEKFLGGKE